MTCTFFKDRLCGKSAPVDSRAKAKLRVTEAPFLISVISTIERRKEAVGTSPATPALATSKKGDWIKLIYLVLLIIVCVFAHYHPWFQPVCHGAVGILVVALFVGSGYRVLKP